jgi:alkanesulfonate monooxygenase SsuD/methylene tetrahydromethanopterin reductase-like flavin-dependent oxidoreductase (luciferase family)
MLGIVARLAHGWNTFLLPVDEYQVKTSALEQHCKAMGRDPATIRRSLIFQAVIRETEADLADGVAWLARAKGIPPELVRSSALVGTPQQVASKLANYRALGVADFLLAARPPVDYETFRLVGTQVAPELRRSG